MQYQLSRIVAGLFLHTIWRPKVTGAEHVPASGGAILAANHQSVVDSIFLPLMLDRPVTFSAKSEYFTASGPAARLWAWYLKATNQLQMDRDGPRAAQDTLEAALALLRAGNLFAIYPEGTRSPDGRLYRGRPGVGWLALKSGLPVVPVGIHGTRRVLPPGHVVPRPGRIELRIGAPDIGAIEYPRAVKVWIGVKGTADIGLRVDLLAETFLNGAPAGSSQLANLSTGKNGFANAVLYTVPIPVMDAPSGTLVETRISARRSCSGTGLNSGTVRLWYNGQPIDAAPGKDAGSRLGATANGHTGYLFLREGFALDPVPGPGGASNLFADELLNSASACTGAGRPFIPFGTWSTTVP